MYFQSFRQRNKFFFRVSITCLKVPNLSFLGADLLNLYFSKTACATILPQNLEWSNNFKNCLNFCGKKGIQSTPCQSPKAMTYAYCRNDKPSIPKFDIFTVSITMLSFMTACCAKAEKLIS
jgi:hypothetical protein